MNERIPNTTRIFIICWMMALVAIALFIRLEGADRFHYSPDEAMHASIAKADTLGQVLQFSRDEIHPPLSYVLFHYWMGLSTDPAFVRGLSLLFGLATIPLYYGIGNRLNGPLTGLACAAFVAFGNGCIIQSYVVRQYMVFLFFISVAFYVYLSWRESRKSEALLLYALCAMLACLSHFSAIFTVFCIAIFELARSLRSRMPVYTLWPWIAANALIGLTALYVYHLWQPILVPLKSYFATHIANSFSAILTHTLFYPLVSPGYILPNYIIAIVFLGGLVNFAVTHPRFVSNLKGLRSVLWLNALAYALGMIMVATRIYPEPGTRHSLWLMPFVISAAGWMLSDALSAMAQALRLPRSSILPLCAVIMLVAGWELYNPKERFKDNSEYVWPQKEWGEFVSAMEQLGPDDLIVTEKDDGILLANLYPVMGEDALTGLHMAALAPYGKSGGILFNPYFPRNYNTGVLLATLREAQSRHMLDSIQNLVFLRMSWSRSPLTDLMLCDALPKQLTAIPAFTSGFAPSRQSILNRYAAWMIISKTQLQEILASSGSIQACLDGKHDEVSQLEVPAGAVK